MSEELKIPTETELTSWEDESELDDFLDISYTVLRLVDSVRALKKALQPLADGVNRFDVSIEGECMFCFKFTHEGHAPDCAVLAARELLGDEWEGKPR